MFYLEKELSLAFKQQNNHYLKTIHFYLNSHYYNLFLNRDYVCAMEPNEWAQFKYIESTWMTHEINDCLNRYHCALKIDTVATIQQIVKDHYAYQHPLFDYLEHKATFSDFKKFFENDAVLNVEFFDYLALSLPATSDQTKREIMRMLMARCGYGEIRKDHSNQFLSLLNAFNIDYQRDKMIPNLSWEGLAGINLFSYLSQYGFNKMKYFGLLAATQIVDPPHYTKIINGLTRIGNQEWTPTHYFKEHNVFAKQNSSHHWIKKIVLKELMHRPYQTIDFWIGLYLRLDFMQRYYDSLYHSFINKKAA